MANAPDLQQPTTTKVLANMTIVPKTSIDLKDVFKYLVVAVPAVMCFILNAPVLIKSSKESLLNGLDNVKYHSRIRRKGNFGND